MPVFQLKSQEEFSLKISGVNRRYRAEEHPSAPGFAHGMEGGKAKVYRVTDLDAHTMHAFKVMKRRHQVPLLEEICGRLDRLKSMPGMAVCQRTCLSPTTAKETVERERSLLFAILMPWIEGKTWFDVLMSKAGEEVIFDQAKSLQLATSLAVLLADLEANGVAHCDLSPGNIIIDIPAASTQLIDVEDVYARDFTPPQDPPRGTSGYGHRTSHQGQWNACADRFAGAILLCEMLGWYDAAVRGTAYGESYFDPQELQASAPPRFRVLADALREHHPHLATLLAQAWNSQELAKCPSMQEWRDALLGAKRGIIMTPINRPPPKAGAPSSGSGLTLRPLNFPVKPTPPRTP